MGKAPSSTWPHGTVAFLFTDVEGSTALWERYRETMPAASARHDAIVRDVTTRHGGIVYKVIGDAFQIAFPDAATATAAAVESQRDLAAEPWPLPSPLRVRMAIHCCSAAPDPDGDYRTPELNRLGRLLGAGHGGQVLLSAAAAAAVSRLPPGARLLDLGERRLKDLPGTDRVFQLAAAGLLDQFPPLKTLDPRPCDLPTPPSPLIGRSSELASIRALVRDHGARFVTLTGPGGVGKTRLMVAAAFGLVDGFEDGVRWVPLASLTDSGLVVATVAERLGIREEPGRPLGETLIDWLHLRNVLLVLDNCEQVIDGVADAVAAWIDASPRVQVLATSRTRLRLRVEHAIVVEPLATPREAVSDLAGLSVAPAGAFVLDRAQAIHAVLEDADAFALACVCRLVDGLPLAIELAAARLDRFGATELADRLSGRLGELADGPRDLPARQQTLRDTIAWSYDLLTEDQRSLFRLTAAFSGGATLDAIGVVARQSEVVMPRGGTESIATLVAELVDQSLIRFGGETEAASDRLSMLETVRAYGVERLIASGEEEATRAAHLAHFLAIATASAATAAGADQAARFDALEAEHANFRAALAWGLDGTRAPEETLKLATALANFWRVRGHLSEGVGWLQQALDAARGVDHASRATALHALGNIASDRGDYLSGRACFLECLELRRDLSDAPGIADVLNSLGVIAIDQGDFDGAERVLQESLSLRRAIGDPDRIALTLSNLGAVKLHQGHLDTAVSMLSEARILFEPTGDDQRRAYVLNMLGMAARRRGDLDGAEVFYNEALGLNRTLGFTQGVGGLLNNLGMVAFGRGDVDRAIAYYEEALGIWSALGDTPSRARTLCNLADVLEETGNPATVDLYKESLALRRTFGDQPGIVDCLSGIAGMLATGSTRNAARAARLLGAAEMLRERIGLAVPPSEKSAHDRRVAAALTSLGPALFDAEWAAGRAMTPDRAIDEALSVTHVEVLSQRSSV